MMKLNFNEFLLALSSTIDFIAMDILGVSSYHSRRVAYISCRLAKELGFEQDECFDIISLSILHDNGLSRRYLHNTLDKNNKDRNLLESLKPHCIIGEENIKDYPFLTDVKDVIRYHHEHYDGTGFFGLKGNEIPFFSQIIALGDNIDNSFDLKHLSLNDIKNIRKFVKENENVLFSPILTEAFLSISSHTSFWLDLKDIFLNQALNTIMPIYFEYFSWEQIRQITRVFSNIIDSKSNFTQRHSKGLAEKISNMCDYYNKDRIEKIKLVIAADLHDIGKIAISNDIIDKRGKLTEEEFALIKEHPYYTRYSLQQIEGFEDITEWASNHHEKLDGSGYPFGLKACDLDFNSRLMCCLDIYQALTEERPYRKSLRHKDSMRILNSMVNEGKIDKNIVKDIDAVLGKKITFVTA